MATVSEYATLSGSVNQRGLLFTATFDCIVGVLCSSATTHVLLQKEYNGNPEMQILAGNAISGTMVSNIIMKAGDKIYGRSYNGGRDYTFSVYITGVSA